MNGTDIAGYVLAEQTYCPTCIHDLFIPFDLIGGPAQSTEEILNLVAKQRGIDRHDEASYSSYRFPKPIYLADVSGDDFCVSCGRPLDGHDDATR